MQKIYQKNSVRDYFLTCNHCFLIESEGGCVASPQMDSQLPAKPTKPHPQPLQAEPHPHVQDDPNLLQIKNEVIQLSSKSEVANNIEKLYHQFTCLVAAIKSKFETFVTSGKLTVDQVAHHANAFLHQPISRGSVDKMFDDMQNYFDFLSNFAVIKSLVIQFFPEEKELQTKLTQYIDCVNKFLEFSQLKHIRSAIEEKLSHLQVSPSTSDQTKPVAIILNELWDNMTLENFKKVLKYYFEPDIADLFSHISIKKGSVIITLLIPTTQTQYLIDTINNKTNSMNRLGILGVAVDNNTIPIRRENDNNFDASLHQAVKAGESFEVSVLLQLGADPNSKNEEGKYPVEIARERGHNKVIQTLLTGGAIESKFNDYYYELCN